MGRLPMHVPDYTTECGGLRNYFLIALFSAGFAPPL